jgi:transposase
VSLPSEAIYSVPEETARIARAIFPKGNIYMRLYEPLGPIYNQADFADLFSALGQPGIQPVRLALVCILQFIEGLTDAQATNAVRTRIDWKYLLGLELTDTGFDPSVLSEFRSRLLNEAPSSTDNMEGGVDVEQRLLDSLLMHFRERGLLKAGGRVRTDSTHVLGAISALNRLQLVIETMRYALNTLAVVAPDWLLQHSSPHWLDRYASRADDFHLPKKEQDRLALIQLVGEDGLALLGSIDDPTAPAWLRQVPALRILRKVWMQNYMHNEGQISWRESDNIPPATFFVSSPYDPEAHYAKKRTTTWTGYKVHLTESCDDDEHDAPHLITHVETSPSPSPDTAATPVVHKKLHAKGLLPSKHLVDMGYIEIALEAETRRDYGVDLIGPMRRDYHRQAHEGQGFEIEHFGIDWKNEQATCPHGKVSSSWTSVVERGKNLIKVKFSITDCQPCPFREKCTNSQELVRRSLTLKPQELHEALRRGRLREQTEEYKSEYRRRAGIEGTISQGVRAFEMRRSRYIGQAKTHLQHVLTAIGINLVRFDNWLLGNEPAQTRRCAFARLLVAA